MARVGLPVPEVKTAVTGDKGPRGAVEGARGAAGCLEKSWLARMVRPQAAAGDPRPDSATVEQFRHRLRAGIATRCK